MINRTKLAILGVFGLCSLSVISLFVIYWPNIREHHRWTNHPDVVWRPIVTNMILDDSNRVNEISAPIREAIESQMMNLDRLNCATSIQALKAGLPEKYRDYRAAKIHTDIFLLRQSDFSWSLTEQRLRYLNWLAECRFAICSQDATSVFIVDENTYGIVRSDFIIVTLFRSCDTTVQEIIVPIDIVQSNVMPLSDYCWCIASAIKNATANESNGLR